METKKERTDIHLIIAVSMVALSFIAAGTVYNINDRTLMSKNIEQAITKGIDPLSVKCSYQTSIDPICLSYSMKK